MRRPTRTWAVAALVAVLPLVAPQPTATGAPVARSARHWVAPQPGAYWWYDAMRLRAAHRVATGRGVRVAVIDYAIDPTAPGLAGAHVRLADDSCLVGRPTRPVHGQAAEHGSAMTALIAGTGRGGSTPGVAPDASVTFFGMDRDGDGDALDDGCDAVALAYLVQRVAADGYDVVSMSVGGYRKDATRQVIDQALRSGAVLVAAAGDTDAPDLDRRTAGMVQSPASWPGFVAVQAVGRDAAPASFNPRPFRGYGEPVSGYPTIAGPGVAVPALSWSGGRWVDAAPVDGTSPATALVAGSLALVRSRYPHATAGQVLQQLVHRTGGTRPYSWDARYGFGIVSPTEMLATDPAGWPDRNPLLAGAPRAVRAFPVSSYHAGATASPSPTPTQTASPSPAASTTAASSADDGGSSWLPVTVAAVVLAALVALGALVVRRRRA
jgi:MYXO-CTERM domain-containing protein